MKNITLILTALIVLGAGYYWFSSRGDAAEGADTASVEQKITGEEHVITFSDDGFDPAEITIAKGDTVTWKTTTGRLFWPASNLHPSHRDYPGGIFDPKAPIESDATWSFTFELAGDWKYHDHLAPYHTGVIHVE